MAMEVTGDPTPFCFPDCPHMQLDVHRSFVYADDKIHLKTTQLVCANEEVCKMWAQQICKNVCKAESCGLKGLTNPIICIPKN